MAHSCDRRRISSKSVGIFAGQREGLGNRAFEDAAAIDDRNQPTGLPSSIFCQSPAAVGSAACPEVIAANNKPKPTINVKRQSISGYRSPHFHHLVNPQSIDKTMAPD